MNRDQILEILEKFEIPFFQHDTADGSTIVAAERGARVLGLFPCREGSSESALWINPHLDALLARTATDWEGDGTGGMGGDRLWISPERSYYYQKPETFEDWFCQAAMDPGAYHETERTDDSVVYRNTFSLRDLLKDCVLEGVTMQRTLRVLENPYADALPEAEEGRMSVRYVGVESEEMLEAPTCKGILPAVCPWGLTQVAPPGRNASGTVVVPTPRKAEVVHYFVPVPEDRLRVREDHVAFRIDSAYITKIGIRAEDLPESGKVRVAYLRPVAAPGEVSKERPDQWVLLVRESEDIVRDSSGALDPAKADPDGPRGVVQSYNHDGSGASHFGEIEVQYKPVSKAAKGVSKSIASSRLLAYSGERGDILKVAAAILGVSCIDLFD